VKRLGTRQAAVAAAVLACAWLALGPAPGDAAAEGPVYDILYDARLQPVDRTLRVTIRVRQNDAELREVAFRVDPERHVEWTGDGGIEQREGNVTWSVPKGGGALRYVFRIDQLRDDKSYDARCAGDWTIFRGDDLVPPAATRTLKGARSRARLRLRLPEGWSAATPFPAARGAAGYAIESDHRSFDRPLGWILAARRLGVVRETVSGVRLAIAGPAGQDVRRLDWLALLRWTLPELAKLLPGRLPDRMLLIGAGDPMWRGGLSAPNSIFLHADRPLITPDGTSPLLHEVLHTVLPPGSTSQDDWLVEGLAEYYSIGLLGRSHTLSKTRWEKTLRTLADRGRGVRQVRGRLSTGEVTARAVTLLAELDARIAAATDGQAHLDAVVRRMAASNTPLAFPAFRDAVEQVADEDFEDFFDRPIFNK
jgi:hypothetical protein